MKPNLGKLLPIGETFETSTKWMSKSRRRLAASFDKMNTYEILRPGTEKMFQKGKRNYFCRVLALIETRCKQRHSNHMGFYGPREWQFTYHVQILEN